MPTQANYVMCEVLDGKKAKSLAESLLSENNILIKTLENKIEEGEYIRLSVRDERDNNRLIDVLGTVDQ